jgi:hypothetical protein
MDPIGCIRHLTLTGNSWSHFTKKHNKYKLVIFHAMKTSSGEYRLVKTFNNNLHSFIYYVWGGGVYKRQELSGVEITGPTGKGGGGTSWRPVYYRQES